MSLTKVLTLFLAVTTAVSSGDEGEPMANPWEKDYRIPKDIIPIAYNMLLDPNLKEGNFKGEITSLVNITAPRDWVPIHIKNLDISKTVVTEQDGKPVKVLNAFKYLPSQFWVIKTEPLKPGLINIYLKFNGSLIENISGFYKSVYYENGTSRLFWTLLNSKIDSKEVSLAVEFVMKEVKEIQKLNLNEGKLKKWNNK